MPHYLLWHEHEPVECRFAFAAWQGFSSPLRQRPALSTCPCDGHAIWWIVEAANPAAAIAQLPAFVAARAKVVLVSEVTIP